MWNCHIDVQCRLCMCMVLVKLAGRGRPRHYGRDRMKTVITKAEVIAGRAGRGKVSQATGKMRGIVYR